MLSAYAQKYALKLHRRVEMFSTICVDPLPPSAVALRPYQEECINVCLEAFANGIKRQAVSLPVGSGKTVIFSNLINRLKSPNPRATKTLVLAHREELISQAAKQIRRASPKAAVAIEKGSERADINSSDVIIASVPTLGRSDTDRLMRFDPTLFKCIIIDEAHHAIADSYIRIANQFRVFEKDSHLLLWGCSATLSRNDERALGNLFEKIVFHAELGKMVEEGWLAPVQTFQLYTDVDLDTIGRHASDFDQEQLSLLINTPVRNALIVATWKKVAAIDHARKATLVFALNVEHVNSIVTAFRQAGINAHAITGLTPATERVELLEQFTLGEIPVLVNCAVLTEGTDLPITDCILLTRPTCNPNIYTQMVGRGLRKHPSKEYCLVLDVVDQFRRRGRSLITFPTLLAHKSKTKERVGAMDPTEANDELENTETRKAKEYEEIDPEYLRIQIQQMHIDSIDLAGHPLDWIKIRNDLFILASKDQHIVLTVLSTSKFRPLSCNVYTLLNFEFGRLICTNEPIHLALDRISAYLASSSPELHRSLLRGAFWKTKLNATAGQKKYLLQLASNLKARPHESQDIFRWNFGQAVRILSKYTFMKRVLGRGPRTWSSLLYGELFDHSCK